MTGFLPCTSTGTIGFLVKLNDLFSGKHIFKYIKLNNETTKNTN